MQESSAENKKRTVLKIGGMNCAGCVNVIQNRLSDTDGVQKCEVNLGAEKAVLEYDSQVTDIEKIEQAVRDAGYKVVKLKLIPNISSTLVREAIAKSKQWQDFLTPAVAKYIEEIDGVKRIKQLII